MAIGDPYASLADIKDYLSIPATNTQNDVKLTSALDSASLEIERYCGRQFNLQPTATSRLYEPQSMRYVDVDDFANLSGFLVETDPGGLGQFLVQWQVTDTEVFPLNGMVDGQPWPYHRIHSVMGLWFPMIAFRRRATVRVTAQWGWPSVPAPIHQACIIQAAETYRLKDAPFGVAGMDQFGTVLKIGQNTMVSSRIDRYRKDPIMVA